MAKRKVRRIRGVFAGQPNSFVIDAPYPAYDPGALTDESEFLLMERLARNDLRANENSDGTRYVELPEGEKSFAPVLELIEDWPPATRRKFFTLIASHVTQFRDEPVGRKPKQSSLEATLLRSARERIARGEERTAVVASLVNPLYDGRPLEPGAPASAKALRDRLNRALVPGPE